MDIKNAVEMEANLFGVVTVSYTHLDVYKRQITDAYDLGCELQKKRIECAIMIKAAEADMADDAQ